MTTRSISVNRLSLATAAMTCLLALPACAKPPVVLTLTPAPVASMKDGGMVAVKGQAAEIFGNKFILQDGSGRALVETGPKGDDGRLVGKGQTVTVQGLYEHGFIHAQLITAADGKTTLLDMPPPPPSGGPRPPHGPGDCMTPPAPPAPAPDAPAPDVK